MAAPMDPGAWGPEDAAQSVSGTTLDVALLSTQRVAFGLDVLGWRASDGWGMPPETVSALIRDSWNVLEQLGACVAPFRAAATVPPEGRAFARAMLRS